MGMPVGWRKLEESFFNLRSHCAAWKPAVLGLLQIQHAHPGAVQNICLSKRIFRVRWPCKTHGYLSMLPDVFDLPAELLNEPHNFQWQMLGTSHFLATI